MTEVYFSFNLGRYVIGMNKNYVEYGKQILCANQGVLYSFWKFYIWHKAMEE